MKIGCFVEASKPGSVKSLRNETSESPVIRHSGVTLLLVEARPKSQFTRFITSPRKHKTAPTAPKPQSGNPYCDNCLLLIFERMMAASFSARAWFRVEKTAHGSKTFVCPVVKTNSLKYPPPFASSANTFSTSPACTSVVRLNTQHPRSVSLPTTASCSTQTCSMFATPIITNKKPKYR